jgi:stress response protein YsnF
MSGLLNRLTGHNTKEVAEAAGTTHTAKHEQVAEHNPGTTTTVTQTTTQPDQSINQTATNQHHHHGLGTGTQFYTEQPNVGNAAAATNTGLTGQHNAATGNRFVAPQGAVAANQYQSGATPATHQTGLNAVTNTTTTTQQPIIRQQPIVQQQPIIQQPVAQHNYQSNIGLNKVVEPVGQAALNKTVSVEHVQTSVPVKREVPVLQREPITEANRGSALSGPAISEGHYETTLNQEHVQATKEAVPIERIHLGKQVETTMQPVNADIRKEHTEYIQPGATKIDTIGQPGINQTANKSIY